MLVSASDSTISSPTNSVTTPPNQAHRISRLRSLSYLRAHFQQSTDGPELPPLTFPASRVRSTSLQPIPDTRLSPVSVPDSRNITTGHATVPSANALDNRSTPSASTIRLSRRTTTRAVSLATVPNSRPQTAISGPVDPGLLRAPSMARSRSATTPSSTTLTATASPDRPTLDRSPATPRSNTAQATSPRDARRDGQTTLASANQQSTTGSSTISRAALPESTSTRSALFPYAAAAETNTSQLPSLHLMPHHDPRSSRPSLSFNPISRTLPSQSSVIRIGRYSDRDGPPELSITGAGPSDAPVGFKSKVVSRRHCEFSCVNSQWFVRDVKSSSGTFLNHIRLSQPGVESKPYPLNDGDVVQLGIDFKGGEEMIFRCVKIRVELNRGWQKGLNNFNKTTYRRLKALAKVKSPGDAETKHSTECTICLNSIAPCQALFVAPCSHTWHYKCIRPVLDRVACAATPAFVCPNCRAAADLEADVDEPDVVFDDDDDDDCERPMEDVPPLPHVVDAKTEGEAESLRDVAIAGLELDDTVTQPPAAPGPGPANGTMRTPPTADVALPFRVLSVPTTTTTTTGTATTAAASSTVTAGTRAGIAIPRRTVTLPSTLTTSELLSTSAGVFTPTAAPSTGDNMAAFTFNFSPSPSPPTLDALALGFGLGPMTPRNTAGPFVFDGGGDDDAEAPGSK